MRSAWSLVIVASIGCGDSGGTSGSGGSSSTTGTGGASTTSATGGSTTGTGGSTTGTGGGAPIGGCPEGGSSGGTGGGVLACADIGATDCFSNYDCASGERCENVGTDDLPTACCTTGARGTGALGQGCLGEGDCASSVCIDNCDIGVSCTSGTCGLFCSDVCTTDADCPASLPKCIAIAFSGTDDKFCTP